MFEGSRYEAGKESLNWDLVQPSSFTATFQRGQVATLKAISGGD